MIDGQGHRSSIASLANRSGHEILTMRADEERLHLAWPPAWSARLVPPMLHLVVQRHVVLAPTRIPTVLTLVALQQRKALNWSTSRLRHCDPFRVHQREPVRLIDYSLAPARLLRACAPGAAGRRVQACVVDLAVAGPPKTR